MIYFVTVVFSVSAANGEVFPFGFKFGAATSAYQIEGARNVSDNGVNIWDTYIHDNPDLIIDRSNANVTCDSYHLWMKDIDIAQELGLNFYRFSVSWSRVLPSGLPNNVSDDGVKYYNKIIDELLRRNIEPVITMYHFDLPQTLQNLGGWTNSLIVEWFKNYARILFSLYADRVKTWITINEPLIVCDYIYTSGTLAPGILEPTLAPYLCNKHVLLAHAKAWRMYDEEYKPRYQGRMSIAINPVWLEPREPQFKRLAELGRQFGAGRYSHPIYSKNGGWPPSVERYMAKLSKKEGFTKSRLPAFTHEEIKLIRGTYDFYALNHYTSRVIRPIKPGETAGPWIFYGSPELNAVLETPSSWPTTSAAEVVIYPRGIRRQMEWLQTQYGNISFLITENGCASHTKGHYDTDRIEYIASYLKEILKAIKQGINVEGYTAWTLMDNFEWLGGYRISYGLYKVNFESPMRKRTPRESARFYADIIKTRKIRFTSSRVIK